MLRRYLPAALVVLGLVLAGAGAFALGQAGYIRAKAWLAADLIERAWATSLSEDRIARPWPWADTFPIARLRVPALGIDQIVLAGASGRSLAFAPGHLDGTAVPGKAGHAILSGHRDTHFRFLQDLEPGHRIDLQSRDGAWVRYRATGSQVIDSRKARFATSDRGRHLTLVTCYPFDALDPGGPLRYLVSAEAEDLAALTEDF